MWKLTWQTRSWRGRMTKDFGTAAGFRGPHEQKIININHWQFFSKTLDVCQSIPWNHPSWFSHMWLLIMPDLFRRNIIHVLIPKIKCKKVNLRVGNCVSTYHHANYMGSISHWEPATIQSCPECESISLLLSLPKVEKHMLAW